MVHAKNYETVSTFVKVMQKKLWPLFSGHAVYSAVKSEDTEGNRQVSHIMQGITHRADSGYLDVGCKTDRMKVHSQSNGRMHSTYITQCKALSLSLWTDDTVLVKLLTMMILCHGLVV